MEFYQYSKRDACYFCSSPSTSAEHVPPKMLFKGLKGNRITVPSCDRHNSGKGNADQALIIAMALGRHQVDIHNLTNLPPDLRRSITRIKRGQDSVKRQVNLEKFLEDPPEELDIEMPYIRNGQQFLNDWVRHLSAGILWPVIGRRDAAIQWSDATVWSPDFWPGQEARAWIHAAHTALDKTKFQVYLDQLRWISGWGPQGTGSFPEKLFQFDVFFPPRRPESSLAPLAFKFRFYDAYTWYVLFQASPRTIEVARSWVQ